MKRKRTFLFWGPPDMGKSTLALSIADREDMRDVAVFHFDNSGASVAERLAPGAPVRLYEPEVGPDGWPLFTAQMRQVYQAARKGEVNALVLDGLSSYYAQDCGLAAIDHPEKVESNDLSLFHAPTARLKAICAMIARIQKGAKNPAFTVVLTCHVRQTGPIGQQVDVPAMSPNAWKQHVFPLVEFSAELVRTAGAPRLVYKDPSHEFRRVKSPRALKYLDDLTAAARGNDDRGKAAKAQLAKLTTMPGLLALLERAEAQATAPAAPTPKPAEPVTDPQAAGDSTTPETETAPDSAQTQEQ